MLAYRHSLPAFPHSFQCSLPPFLRSFLPFLPSILSFLPLIPTSLPTIPALLPKTKSQGSVFFVAQTSQYHPQFGGFGSLWDYAAAGGRITPLC